MLRTSHALLQRLHENVVWAMRGNFLSVPTDCPQRDERMGWTGDAQVFAPTATTLYDCNGFLGHWLADLRSSRNAAHGVVPTSSPTSSVPSDRRPGGGTPRLSCRPSSPSGSATTAS